MSKLKERREDLARLATKSYEVVNDDRAWSEKAAEFDAIEAEIKAIEPEIKALESVETNRKAFLAATDDNTVDPEVPSVESRNPAVKSLGQQFVESDGFKSMQATDGRSRYSIGVDTKATFTVAAGAAGGVAPEYHMSIVPILLQRLTIAQLIPGGSISGGSLIYPKESSITNAAAAVAEGAPKPASDLNVTQVTETLTKVATTLKVSDETLQDFDAARSYVDGRLALFVQIGEEAQLLNGSGSGANMTGILNRSGLTTAQAVGSDTRADAIFKEITKIRTTAFVEPDGIVLHPTDWQSLRLSKDSHGQYYAGGPFTGAYGNGNVPSADRLWGLPVVVTTAITQGTGLVGSFAMCSQVFRKGGLRVEATNSNEDDFLNNLVAIRAELRELLAVYRPAGFGKVTGL